MAGPWVAVRILGDLSGWSKSVDGTATSATSATSRIKGAFSTVLGQLNASGVLGPFGGAIDAVSKSMETLSEKSSSVGEKFLGVGGAAVGLGMGLQELGSKQQAAQQQLSAAITASGGAYATYSKQIQETISEEEHHGETATETMGALQKLTQVTHDPTEAIKLLGTASDLAAAQHEDLDTAATQLGKTYTGSTRTLKLFGVETLTTKQAATELATAQRGVTAAAKELTDKHVSATKAAADYKDATQFLTQAQKDSQQAGADNSGAIDELSKRMSGQASAASDTFSGKMDYLKARVEDVVTTFATHYGPTITAAGAAMTGLGAAMEVGGGLISAVKDSTILATAAQTAQTAASTIATAATWAFNAAWEANPVGVVVIAIAALVGALVLAYQHITPFRDGVKDLWDMVKTAFAGIKTAVSDVFDWLRDNWPLVLGILTGPFGLAVVAIATHWADVTTFLKGIPGAIKTIFADAGTWLLDAGKAIIEGLTSGITGAASKAVDAVKHVGSDIVSGAKSILHIFSPSAVFADIGANVIAGFVNGVNSSSAAATGAVGGAMSAVIGGAGGVGAGTAGPLVSFGDVSISSGVDLDMLAQHVTAALTAGRL